MPKPPTPKVMPIKSPVAGKGDYPGTTKKG